MPHPMMLRLILALLVCPSLPASARSSEPARVRLSWVRGPGAEGCPDARAVEADVTRRLGYSPFESAENGASIEVLVTHRDLYRAEIQMRSADGRSLGTRLVESAAESCASLAAAAALSIAVMIEPELLTSSQPRPSPSPPPPNAVEPAVTPPPPGDAAPPERADPKGSVFLGALGAAGVLPDFAPGALLRGEVELGGTLVLMVAGYFLPEQELVRSGTRAGFGLTALAPGLCLDFELTRAWSLAGCAALHVGALHVAVAAPEPVDVGEHWWCAGSTGLRLGFASGAFGAALGGDVLVPFERREYSLERADSSARVVLSTEPGLAVLGFLAAGAHF